MVEKGTMNPLNASQSTVCGLAWKRYSRQTPLRDVARALNGRASLARVRPCRTGAARFMVGRARGRARWRAQSAAGGQIGNTGTFRGKPRRNGRACGRQYLRSAICATRSKAPVVPRPDTAHTGPFISLVQGGMSTAPALFAGSQGGTVAPAGGNTYAPLSARLDLRP